MGKIRKALDIDICGGLTDEVTTWAGVSLLVELFRRVGVGEVADKVLAKKRSPKGLSQGQMVESFVLLSALGGECVDDVEHLRGDMGLEVITGHEIPAASTARQWLDRFHQEELLAERPLQGSFIPSESVGLSGLRETLRRVIQTYVGVVKPGDEVTLDVDAHLVESAKETALWTYEGYRGYQPMVVQWAETGLILADEFRDGNVPASSGIARMVDEAFDALPQREWKVRVRSDSAAYEHKILDHWHNRGWEFAVSADMSPQLREAIVAVPEEEWQYWKTEKRGLIREWAEVVYAPSLRVESKEAPLYRYLAIRVRKEQGELFADGGSVRHYAVVTNRWEEGGQALLGWQRGKAGTIEHAHHVLVNELAAGVYPSSKFGANAAWLRLQVLTHNLLEMLKVTALPEKYRKARPKKLRFAVFTQFGRVIRHAGRTMLRVVTVGFEELIKPGRKCLRDLMPLTG